LQTLSRRHKFAGEKFIFHLVTLGIILFYYFASLSASIQGKKLAQVASVFCRKELRPTPGRTGESDGVLIFF
ncbi:hypothetical protein, partial [Waltera sp.]|uniref:hypothetical protein n=1 Tax=Waltera sp. TaxID=2815806 RepID=UPI003AB94C99